MLQSECVAYAISTSQLPHNTVGTTKPFLRLIQSSKAATSNILVHLFFCLQTGHSPTECNDWLATKVIQQYLYNVISSFKSYYLKYKIVQVCDDGMPIKILKFLTLSIVLSFI
jgi:hypothetical protein